MIRVDISPLLVSFSDQVGGGSVAARRLNTALRSIDVPSNLYVRKRVTSAAGVYQDTGILHASRKRIASVADRAYVDAFSPSRRGPFSAGMFGVPLSDALRRFRPTLVHFHWAQGGFIQMSTLARLDIPLVWTLHDAWLMTGGCHLPGDCASFLSECARCPITGGVRAFDMANHLFHKKLSTIKRIADRLLVIAPSEWMAQRARSSTILRDVRVEVIPNAIDTAEFSPIPAPLARQRLALPYDIPIILFGAVNAVNDPNKGFGKLTEALATLAATRREPIHLAMFGTSQLPDVKLPFRVSNLGILRSPEELSLAYSAADVFVLPSLQENLPYTVIEAMACATPCAAFDVGGVAEIIEHKHTGYLARPASAQDLATGIAWLLDRVHGVAPSTGHVHGRSIGADVREAISSRFGAANVAQRHVDTYVQALR